MEQTWSMEGGGRLTAEEQGQQVLLCAERPADGRGLYKVWLRGAGEGRTLLGTLTPEGDRLSLRRRLSRDGLVRSGCWPIRGAEARLAFSFHEPALWHCEPCPGRLVAPPELRRQLPGSMLCRREGDGFALAAPFFPGGAFPLPGLFCLAQVRTIDGRPHAVFFFDGAGRPKLPGRQAAAGPGAIRQDNSEKGPDCSCIGG